MTRRAAAAACLVLLAPAAALRAHSGPPYPILSNQDAGAYRISIWTDPDATDDGTAGGQFWITLEPRLDGRVLPADTRARVSVRALDRNAPPHEAMAAVVSGDPSRRFVSLVMDHEGRYAVRVGVDGGLGAAEVSAEVQATYDLRPAPGLIAVYVLPFLLVGFLWTRLLLRRRRLRQSAAAPVVPGRDRPAT